MLFYGIQQTIENLTGNFTDLSRSNRDSRVCNSATLVSSGRRVVRASASGALCSGLISSRVNSITLKLVITASLFDV